MEDRGVVKQDETQRVIELKLRSLVSTKKNTVALARESRWQILRTVNCVRWWKPYNERGKFQEIFGRTARILRLTLSIS